MQRLVSFLALFLGLSFVQASAQTKDKPATAPKPTMAKAVTTEFFPVEKVKPGMRATGYTVFDGSEPKPFEVEILGVLDKKAAVQVQQQFNFSDDGEKEIDGFPGFDE